MRTPEELKQIEEQNYHGAISALFTYDGPAPSVRQVLDTIERRFGVTNEVQGKLTTIEICEMLRDGLAEAMQHLRPDTVDWFRQRIDYLLACAAERVKPES